MIARTLNVRLIQMRGEQGSGFAEAVGPYATATAVIATLFVGFLQLSGWFVLLLGVPAVYGMQYYYPSNFRSLISYVVNFVMVLIFLSLFEWVARIASLYMIGHQFIGRIQ